MNYIFAFLCMMALASPSIAGDAQTFGELKYGIKIGLVSVNLAEYKKDGIQYGISPDAFIDFEEPGIFSKSTGYIEVRKIDTIVSDGNILKIQCKQCIQLGVYSSKSRPKMIDYWELKFKSSDKNGEIKRLLLEIRDIINNKAGNTKE